MFYNRMESYRHSFGKPPEIRLEIQREAEAPCCVFGLLLDVSAGGAKIFSEHELIIRSETIKFFFKINHEKISARGELVWKSKTSDGWVSGVAWQADPVLEMLIRDEINSRIASI